MPPATQERTLYDVADAKRLHARLREMTSP